ncbi:LOW QUALITY PROTEIN: ribonucleoprotein PTB-binding 1-like [Nilaparvata lugens]|uniref:LOW QUALITY PROTEIN: ribonucleoprotein PTB-binding 1-like n=1 Tax=Nilaparvata lugens TaxID=108931 RepID=UPI00193D66D6|nr:LOW QUALITY PROTEIN: ribonucleoprotein PTB-binding 1-like [Nilaparvata lugens]
MAAGSTEAAFTSPASALGCFNPTLLKNDSNKYWNGGHIIAIASTDGFWEDDPEEKVKKKVLNSKSKFHMGRQLQIKHLPRDVTEEEIRELLCDFPVQSVQVMNSGTGSSMARAILEDPEMLEDWDRNRVFLLRGQCVPVTPTLTEMMLCVARLPLNYTEEQFTTLISAYGEVRRHFLMISEKTGESKGYGFVEYVTKECALQAKNMLDKKQIDAWTLVCDWLDSSHVTFESLQSKCLYVDRLPKDFRDMGEFRKIFSPIVNPPYCQIALKHGCPQDWGLVEFSNWEDAEVAQSTLNGYTLRGQQIRISYYIPGVHAINLYLKLLNDPGPKVKTGGLLPDPSRQVIIQSLQNLFNQNPIFAQNLQNIIMGQIQASHTGEVTETPSKQGSGQGTANNTKGIDNQDANGGKGFHLSEKAAAAQGANPKIIIGIPVSSPQGTQPNGGTYFQPPHPPPLPQNIVMAGANGGNGAGRRPSLSPTAPGEVPTPPLQLDDESSYWAGLLPGALRRAHPPAFSRTLPPHRLKSTLTSTSTCLLRSSTRVCPICPVELQQGLITYLANPTNWQQFVQQLHSVGQAPPPFPFPLNPMQPVDGVGWGIPPAAIPRSMIRSPIPMVQPNQAMFAPAWAPPPPPPPPPPGFLPPSPPQPLFPPFGAPGIIWSQPPTLITTAPPTNSGMTPIGQNTGITPIGQKRRLLPDPEPTPEGDYVGQHSQGIGGHYADSFKRKKKN